MMRALRFIVALLAALAFGCDDQVVQEKVQSVMQNGAVEAQAECVLDAYGCLNPGSIRVGFTKFIDGSCLVQQEGYSNPGQGASEPTGMPFDSSILIPRSSPDSASCRMVGSVSPGSSWAVSVEGGEVLWHDLDAGCCGPQQLYCAPFAKHVSLTSGFCTGFNLEAFGVE